MTLDRLPTVGEYMDRRLDTLTADMDILEAVDLLLEKRITGAIVTNSERELVGILTELDCLKTLTMGANNQPARGKVKDFMTAEVRSIPPTMDVYYAAGLFMQVPFRRFPVVEDGRVVGAITRFDILRAARRGFAPFTFGAVMTT